jgi:elongation factor P
MATTADFRNGMCLELEGQYYFIVEFLHVKPGKGPAFVRTKLKNVTTGRILDKTFNAGVKVDEVRIERRPFQYLYRDDMGYNFMNSETFEQVSIPAEQIDGVEFLKEGDIVEVKYMPKAERFLPPKCPLMSSSKLPIPNPASKAIRQRIR